MNLKEVCLALGLTPRSVIDLLKGKYIPATCENGEWNVNISDLNEWRSKYDPPFTVFGSIDSRARRLQDGLKAKGVDVELLKCSVCGDKDEDIVASRVCYICDLPVCRPHSLHYLKSTPSPNSPPAVCDVCFETHNLDCYGS